MHSDFDCGSTPLALCETSEICTANDLRRKRKQFGVLGEVRLRQLGKLTGRVVSQLQPLGPDAILDRIAGLVSSDDVDGCCCVHSRSKASNVSYATAPISR